MTSPPPLPLLLTLAMVIGGASSSEEGAQHLMRCIRMAEPLVRTPDYIFPLTSRDIELVCKLWDEFVHCVKEYAMIHLTATQQNEFFQVIDTSMKSVNQLCVNDPEYLRAYMGNAPCLRRVSTNSSLCGGQYRYMADVVQGLQASDAQVCCAHLKFRECVLQRTPRECDGEGQGGEGPPSRFMRTMLDRALGYLLQKCQNFVPNARDCQQGNIDLTTHATNVGGGDSGEHSHNHLGPDVPPTPGGPPPHAHTSLPTTRFTWTTAPTPQLTSDPTVGIAGNSLLGPESQQYRGVCSSASPTFAVLLVALFSVAAVSV